ncbi:hypothetical protein [Puia sp.]|jgi:hypothetical protein|uniref:hypothetical protein n=1 Tax=Puia sp. TaxID=2045100 RepID=UPI002F421231
MNDEKTFPLTLDFAGQHYTGRITPSTETGKSGMPVYFRVTLGDKLFAYLCCGDNGWSEKDPSGADRPEGLVKAIGNYILEFYE